MALRSALAFRSLRSLFAVPFRLFFDEKAVPLCLAFALGLPFRSPFGSLAWLLRALLAFLGVLGFSALPFLACHFERSEKSIDKVWILRLRLRMTRLKQTPCGLLVILSEAKYPFAWIFCAQNDKTPPLRRHQKPMKPALQPSQSSALR